MIISRHRAGIFWSWIPLLQGRSTVGITRRGSVLWRSNARPPKIGLLGPSVGDNKKVATNCHWNPLTGNLGLFSHCSAAGRHYTCTWYNSLLISSITGISCYGTERSVPCKSLDIPRKPPLHLIGMFSFSTIACLAQHIHKQSFQCHCYSSCCRANQSRKVWAKGEKLFMFGKIWLSFDFS